MELIDSHCHLDMSEFDPDRDEVIRRAVASGVVQMLAIGIDADSSAAAIALAEGHDFIFPTVGHHPHDASRLDHRGLDRLRKLAANKRVVGFGEIGLDFFRDHSPRDVQRKCFAELIRIGMDAGLPLIIHDRDAHEEVYNHLASAHAERVGGVIHCFSGDYPLARRFLDLNFYISIPGTVTFPKAELVRDVATRVPLDRLLIETDAPYLAPVPRRGRRNEPALVRHTAEEVARLRGIGLEELAEATTANARTLFGLPLPEAR